MRFKYILSALNLILRDFGLVVLIPVLVAFWYREYPMAAAFGATAALSLAGSFIINSSAKLTEEEKNLNDIKRSEALMVVSLSWIIISCISAIPYIIYGLPVEDGLFEAVSGITATGATILKAGVSSLGMPLQYYTIPKTLLFWRSFTQWIGGMGIIVLFVAILPQFAVAGRQMFFAEAPGPTEDKFTPRIKNTASALWFIYAGLTGLCAAALWFAGMPVFDSVCNAFSTLSAGGFSPNPESIAGYHSTIINWIIICFMFLAGTSFVLQSKVIKKHKLLLFFKSEEFRFYGLAVLLISTLLGLSLFIQHGFTPLKSITDAIYQTLSLATSTGSASADFELWSFDAKILLYFAMFLSSCSGSAGGGIKITRYIILLKFLKNELYKILHPKAVLSVKIDGRVVQTDVIRQTIFFVVCFFGLCLISSLLLGYIEKDINLALSCSISAIGDIGPGVTAPAGPMGNFASLQPVSKLIMIFDMLIGRLEIIPFIVMFHKDFWKLKK